MNVCVFFVRIEQSSVYREYAIKNKIVNCVYINFNDSNNGIIVSTEAFMKL